MVMNFLSFCLSRNAFIYYSFLKNIFAEYSILDCQVFFFQHFDISFYSFLTCKVSAEKIADSLMGVHCFPDFV